MPTSLPRASVVVGYGMATIPMAAFLSGTLVEIAVTAWIVAALAAMVFDRELFARFRGAPVLPATLALLAAWTLSMIVAKPYPRLPSIVPLLFPLVFPIAQAILARLPASRRWLLVSAGAFVVGMGVLAVLQVFFDVPIRNGPEEWGWWRMHPDYPFHRATGLYRSPSHVAAAVGSSFFFFLGMGFGGLALVALFVALATLIKAVWTGIAAGVLTMLLVQPRKSVSRIAGVVVLGAGLLLVATPATRSAFERFTPERQASRLAYWKLAWDMFLERPVFGHGFRSFRWRAEEYLPADTVRRKWGSLDPHNTYLEMLSGSGIVGFVAFAAWLVFLARELFRATDVRRRLTGLSLLAYFLVASCFAHYFTERTAGPLTLLLLAYCAADLGARRGAPSLEEAHRASTSR
jgi:O-antigen ligase